MSPNPLRNVPSVNELLENPRLRKLVDRINPGAVVSGVRTVLEEVRNEVQSAASEKTLPSVSELAERIARRVLETQESSLRPVINATGVLLGTELGGPPLAGEAAAAMGAVAQDYASLQLDLASGEPSGPCVAVEALLRDLTGAEAALVVSSTAGATVLAAGALAAGRELIIGRGQLGATDPKCRLAELVTAGGAAVCEVGATNLIRPEDYQGAIGERSAGLLAVQPMSYALVGLCEEVPIKELVALGRAHALPVIQDIGWGGVIQPVGLPLENLPTAADSLALGVDVVLVRGDQLLGGPPCGLILGRRASVRLMAEHPAAGAFQVDKLTLAGLEATLRLWRKPEEARRAIPLLDLLGTSVENLANRAARLAPQFAATGAVATADVVEATAYVAGLPLPGQELPTRQIALEPEGMSVEQLASALRAGVPSVVGILGEDRLLLDLRSVIPRQDQALVEALNGLDRAEE